MEHLIFAPIRIKKSDLFTVLDILDKYLGKTGLFDHFLPIFIIQNLLRPPLLGFEVRDDVLFSQSGHDCPVIPHPLSGNIMIVLTCGS